jgi:hypothetical protein
VLARVLKRTGLKTESQQSRTLHAQTRACAPSFASVHNSTAGHSRISLRAISGRASPICLSEFRQCAVAPCGRRRPFCLICNARGRYDQKPCTPQTHTLRCDGTVATDVKPATSLRLPRAKRGLGVVSCARPPKRSPRGVLKPGGRASPPDGACASATTHLRKAIGQRVQLASSTLDEVAFRPCLPQA